MAAFIAANLIGLRSGPLSVDGPAEGRDHDHMSNEAPGGTVGCDVCGLTVDAEKSAAHRAWHRREEDRLSRIEREVRELQDQRPAAD